MARYIARRLTLMLPVLLGISILVFAVLHLAPGDPIFIMMGMRYDKRVAADLRAKLGLDQPIYVQYLLWLGRISHGDFGRSIYANEPALALVASRLPNTIVLTVTTMIIAVGLGIPLGILSAARKDTWIDNITRVVTMFGISMPVFWFGLLLLLAFGLYLRWFPVGGWVGEYGPKAVVLPSIALGTSFSALISRMTRSSMVETLTEDYIRTARSKGVLERTVYLRHSLKNAFLPVLTVIGMQFGDLLGGAVLTETVFTIPGMGRLLLESILTRDYPVIQTSILVITVGFVVINLLVDILYGLLDPRIRYN